MAATVERVTRPAVTPRLAPQRRRGLRAGLFGVGAAVPERVITNADLEQRLDTTDEWIVRRTGIRERRVLAPDELLSDLATDASQADMLSAGRVDPMLRMEGREVYRHAIRRMVTATNEAIERAGLTIDDIDLFVAHQANVRILTATAGELGL